MIGKTSSSFSRLVNISVAIKCWKGTTDRNEQKRLAAIVAIDVADNLRWTAPLVGPV